MGQSRAQGTENFVRLDQRCFIESRTIGRNRRVIYRLFGSPSNSMNRIIESDQLNAELEKISYNPTPRTFALQVVGDDMLGKGILDGDFAVLEHGLEPRPGDVVAVYIDNKSVLRTYAIVGQKPCLAEVGSTEVAWIPAQDLVIQGVMVALIRRFR